jgi:hypothetical protein
MAFRFNMRSTIEPPAKGDSPPAQLVLVEPLRAAKKVNDKYKTCAGYLADLEKLGGISGPRTAGSPAGGIL